MALNILFSITIIFLSPFFEYPDLSIIEVLAGLWFYINVVLMCGMMIMSSSYFVGITVFGRRIKLLHIHQVIHFITFRTQCSSCLYKRGSSLLMQYNVKVDYTNVAVIYPQCRPGIIIRHLGSLLGSSANIDFEPRRKKEI